MKKNDKLFYGGVFTVALWAVIPLIILSVYNFFLFLGFWAWLTVLLLMLRWGERTFPSKRRVS